MKRFFALLLCLCMAVSLVACGGTLAADPASSAPAGSDSASAEGSADPGAESSALAAQSTEPSAPAVVTGDPNVALEKVADTVMGDDGTVLVNYEYDRAIVTLPDAQAQMAVQESLDQELQVFLDFVAKDLTDYAKDAMSYSQETEAEASQSPESSESSENSIYSFQPYYAQYTITPSRVDDAVLSLVVDNVSYSGGAHGSDNRYCLNYDAKTGQRLTFEMLGKDFRAKAEELVLAKAEAVKEQLEENYAAQLPLVVTDGTESLDEINRKVYPDLYEDTSIEPETGNVDAEFYLNEKGVLFIAGEYVMKPYAGGIMEFGIPYKKFGDSFNQAYLPKATAKSEKAEEKADKSDQTPQADQDADASAAPEGEEG